MRHELDVVTVVAQLDGLVAAQDRDVARSAGRGGELLFQAGLVEHRGCRPARGAGTAVVEAQQRRAADVTPFVDVGRLGKGLHLVADAGLGEQPRDLVVEMDRAGEGVRGWSFLQHDHRMPALRHPQRQVQPDRAGAHDRDVIGIHAGQ